MTQKLTLRLQPGDIAAFDAAAAAIAGPAGAAWIGRTAILRRALAEFNAAHGAVQEAGSDGQ